MFHRGYLLIVRLAFGIFFLNAFHNKIKREFGEGWLRVVGWFLDGNRESMPGWYAAFVDAVVTPNQAAFGYTVIWAECLLGVALILGVFTRLSCALGIFMMANFMIAQGAHPLTPGLDQLLIWGLLTLMFASAGRTYGLDQFIVARAPQLRVVA